jgi:clan AA aspartic protease (TIGR02281 family)
MAEGFPFAAGFVRARLSLSVPARSERVFVLRRLRKRDPRASTGIGAGNSAARLGAGPFRAKGSCDFAAGLLLALAIAVAGSLRAEVPTLAVKSAGARLYAQQGPHAEAIRQLPKGEKLVPMARTPGETAWYLVRTADGAVGWVRAEEVEASEALARAFEPPARPSPATRAEIESPATQTISAKGKPVPIEINGPTILVPVLLNRTVKTHMIVDTGATLTMVSKPLAKRLGLRAQSQVSILTANGTISAPLARLGSIKVGTAEVHGLEVTVAPQRFTNDPRVEGLLGLNFLSRFHLAIDSRQQQLVLSPR